MRSVSYTKGASANHYNSFNHESGINHITSIKPPTEISHNIFSENDPDLRYTKRTCASMTAGSLRTYSNYNGPTFVTDTQSDHCAEWTHSTSPKKQFYKSSSYTSNLMSQLSIKLEDSKFLNQKFFRNNKKEFCGWLLLVMLIIFGYKFFSDGSFSAVLTLASTFQCFSLVLLNLKVVSQQSMGGISRRSVALIVICLISRLLSTVFFNGYLPVDRSGDWVYQGVDVLSVFLGILLLIYSHYYCISSIQAQQDKDTCATILPMGIAALLAIVLHPKLNQNVFADTAWTFGLYLETYSMIPQLFMMGKLGGEVEALTSHYVASMATSKIFAILFWYFSFQELGPRDGRKNIAGWAVIISYSIQVLLFADFLYYYIKSLRVGRRMLIHF